MRVHLVAAIGDRRRNLTVLLALVAAAVVTTAAAPARAGAATKPAPVLAQGAGMGAKPSAAVRRVQRVLHSRGYSLGRPGVDGRFGPLTAAAVRRFQADSGLAADGIVGPKTRTVVTPRSSAAGRRPRPRAAPARARRSRRTQARDHEPAGHERRAGARTTATRAPTPAGSSPSRWQPPSPRSASPSPPRPAPPGRRARRRPDRRAALARALPRGPQRRRGAWRTSAGTRSPPA